jgi:hypothetical protein
VPGSVTQIDSDAFSGQAVYFTGNAPSISSSAFDSASKIYYLPGTSGWGSEFTNRPTLLWRPQIQANGGMFGIRSNSFGFNITGSSNLVVLVSACTNLSNPSWIALQTVILANGTNYFSERLYTNSPSRFYGLGLP